MRVLAFVVLLALLGGMIYFGNQANTIGSTPVPPLGKLLNPFSGFWQNAEPANLPKETTLRFPGLEAPVTVVFDDRLVPHIFAENIPDALAAQGYLHAKYRLFQMDLTTRASAGRVSEIVGARALNFDKTKRRQGFYWAAEKTVEAWMQSAKSAKYANSYTDGVNAYIEQLTPSDYPIEYKVLDFKPEKWNVLKSAFMVKSMAESLCIREYDIENTNLRNALGEDLFQQLFPDWFPPQSPIIPSSKEWNFTPVSPPAKKLENSAIGMIPHTPIAKPPKNNGSNNWAIHGSKTKSGNTMLSNDPHLPLKLPNIWYEIQIHTPELNAYGVSLTGLPGIIIGFNKDIAWGLTNVGHDLLDWYKIEWKDADKSTYVVDGQTLNTQYRIEQIDVKGENTVYDTVKYTVWGPVVYEDEDHPQKDLAMHWLAHESPDPDQAHCFVDINGAKNYDEFIDALKSFDVPPQNFVFADKEGNVALRITGRLPVKDEQQGKFVREGNTMESSWRGFIPFEHAPLIKNPERGFVASSNQHSTDTDYPYPYVGYFDYYRGRYINERLDSMKEITIDDLKALQTDNKSLYPMELLPLMLEHLDSSQLKNDHFQLLKALASWDYSFDRDAMAPVLFEAWEEQLKENTWDEITRLSDSIPVRYPEESTLVSFLEENPSAAIFDKEDTPEQENAKAIVTLSFTEAMAEFASEGKEAPALGEIPVWEEYKATKIRHLLDLAPFSSDVLEVGGYGEAPNAVKRGHGPSWRMVVELGDEVKAYGIYPGGQSGNPGSPFYQSMIPAWVAGEYYELNFMQSSEDGQALSTIKMEPAR